MERRTLLAIVISIAILLTYQYFFLRPEVRPTATSGNIEKQAVPPPVSPASSAASAGQKTEAAGVSEEGQEVVVDNLLYTATFTSTGGAIKSILLKQYKDENGKPIVLKSDEALPPFSIGANEGFQFAHSPFAVRGSNIELTPEINTASLAFDYSDGSTSIRRTYTFYYNDYKIDLKDEVSGLPTYWITLGKDFGIFNKETARSVHFGPVILKDADRLEFTPQKLKEPKVFKEDVKWIAQEDKYFFSSLVPRGPMDEVMVWNKNG